VSRVSDIDIETLIHDAAELGIGRIPGLPEDLVPLAAAAFKAVAALIIQAVRPDLVEVETDSGSVTITD